MCVSNAIETVSTQLPHSLHSVVLQRIIISEQPGRPLVEDIARMAEPPKRQYATPSYHCRLSWHLHLLVVRVIHFAHPILCYDLDYDALEVNRHASLEFLSAHPENLHSPLEVNVGMMVFVQQGEAVVPYQPS